MLKNYLSIIWIRGIGALKADSENSYLGSLWWVLEPILLAALFFVAFSTGLKGGGKGADFLYFLLCALIPFKWTSSAITGSGTSISSNKGILNQFYLPKWIFPTIVNLSILLRFSIVFPLLCLFFILSGFNPSLNWVFLLPIVACQLFITLGLSFMAAAIVPLVPDTKHIIGLGMTTILFTSGIFFDINSRPEAIQEILHFNPFVSIFDSYRAIIIRGENLDSADLIYPYCFAAVFFLLGFGILQKFDKHYPRRLI
ncbi:ABC transporter permease [Microbulbifer sp. SSSA002]|uniref:ABC transporter permease n=1 Tax=unclassified Microbulbifer TaxID=2619833 RepID=UPI004039C40D